LDIRLFNFAIDTIKFLRTQASSYELNVIMYQLTKSATSSGANYEEAQAGFTNKVRISLFEMRESNYWLRILKGINDEINPELEKLIKN
jgi:four helix bundle protein